MTTSSNPFVQIFRNVKNYVDATVPTGIAVSQTGDDSEVTFRNVDSEGNTIGRTITVNLPRGPQGTSAADARATEVSVTAPTNPVIGQLWYDTSENTGKVWNGTAWVDYGNPESSRDRFFDVRLQSTFFPFSNFAEQEVQRVVADIIESDLPNIVLEGRARLQTMVGNDLLAGTPSSASHVILGVYRELVVRKLSRGGIIRALVDLLCTGEILDQNVIFPSDQRVTFDFSLGFPPYSLELAQFSVDVLSAYHDVLGLSEDVARQAAEQAALDITQFTLAELRGQG